MSLVVQDWAHSASGRNIQLHHSVPLSELERLRPLLFVGGVHGDEPEGIALAKKLLAWLKNNTVQSHNPWLLIECINPDGEATKQRTNGNGVDLNRNFPSRDWSSESKGQRYYPGPNPGSEPEVQALVALALKYRPRLIVHFHSWKPGVIFAGDPTHPAPGYLAQSSGYPIQPDIGYPTPGSLGQWGWLDQGIPVICTEEAEGASADETWTRFGPGLQKIFEQEIPLPVK
ncbi:MAG: DUF2817 domain-containing protein [Bdellovibrionaceae bacterium]|nr:DUF2817 domain-containing protein [Bdellovibrionales bacterium]MCB9086450.1 DUF2817 domain-containing protein [Pseudobdellovibrionaceae bacterium]